MEGIDQKENDVELAKSSRRALISQIAIGVAHEIRNPLTVIKGYLQLQEKKSVHGTDESLGIIFEELHQIELLVTNIISLAQNKAIKKRPENLNNILERIYPAVQRAAGQNGIITELRLGSNLPMLDLHAQEIEQMVLNLTRNGIEAMRANGRLTIGTVRKSGRVILYVQDEGGGIPPEQRKQIFDPFYTTKVGNTGLGLAISLSIVERHQGEMEVVSTLGVGSIFKTLFPI